MSAALTADQRSRVIQIYARLHPWQPYPCQLSRTLLISPPFPPLARASPPSLSPAAGGVGYDAVATGGSGLRAAAGSEDIHARVDAASATLTTTGRVAPSASTLMSAAVASPVVMSWTMTRLDASASALPTS